METQSTSTTMQHRHKKKKRFWESKMPGTNGMINTGIAIVLTDYYKKMFSSSNSSPSTSILSQIPQVITKYLNV